MQRLPGILLHRDIFHWYNLFVLISITLFIEFVLSLKGQILNMDGYVHMFQKVMRCSLSSIINPLLPKLAQPRWAAVGLVPFCVDLDSVSQNSSKWGLCHTLPRQSSIKRVKSTLMSKKGVFNVFIEFFLSIPLFYSSKVTSGIVFRPF